MTRFTRPLRGLFLAYMLFLQHSAWAEPAEVIRGEYLLKIATPESGSGPALAAQSKPNDSVVKFKLNRGPLADLIGEDSKSHAPLEKATALSDCEELKHRFPSIEFCEPNYVLKASAVPNDTRYLAQYALAKINAPQAWDSTVGSASVVVAVIDTGIDLSHPDLANNVWTNVEEISGNGIDDDNNGFVDDVHGFDFSNRDNDPSDDNGHGTHCAGIIGASGNNAEGIAGINWSVSLMPLKFLDGSGAGSTSDAIDAIDYAIQNGAKVISASWGGPSNSLALQSAIGRARDAGVLFVAAAGNDGSNTDVYPNYPSGYPLDNVISVAASNAQDTLASFSNYGVTSVDIAAPGVNIVSTYPGGGYATLSGTSMATPHVAGLAGLVWSQFPNAAYTEIRAHVLSGDLVPGLLKKLSTGSRINAARALSLAQAEPIRLRTFHGPRSSNTLRPSSSFSALVSGPVGQPVLALLKFRSSSRGRLPSCSLGTFSVNTSGTLRIRGKLTLGALRGRVTAARLSLTGAGQSLTRHVSSSSYSSSSRRRINLSNLSSKACSAIKKTLVVQ